MATAKQFKAKRRSP
uniref:Uncharacterized protein n=1 Tax=Arundo donax TaxID=35708 RepID=A0A0A8Y3M2_ARUDO